MTRIPPVPDGRSARLTPLLALIFGMPLLLLVLHTGFLAVVALRSHYSWREMDWDGDGRTTLAEALATADVLERPAVRQGRRCVELVWAKTGRPIRVECGRGTAPA